VLDFTIFRRGHVYETCEKAGEYIGK